MAEYDRCRDPSCEIRKRGGRHANIKLPDHVTQHWSVTVTRNGEQVVCIESNCLSGKSDISAEDQRIMRVASDHLRGFAGADQDNDIADHEIAGRSKMP
jgi:hypothetical protein